jgi:hypothetical protein
MALSRAKTTALNAAQIPWSGFYLKIWTIVIWCADYRKRRTPRIIPRNKIIYKLATEPKKFQKLTIDGVDQRKDSPTQGLKNLTTAEQRTKAGEQSLTSFLTAPKKDSD